MRQLPWAMCSSGTAARSRTAHLMVTARLGYSMTSGPASHSTRVSAPMGELYEVHSTRMRSPREGAGTSRFLPSILT